MNNVRPKVDFKRKQAEFSAYIRDPLHNPCPADVHKQRMEVYRELFFNNIDSFLSSNFPVLRKILSDRHWYHLAEDFFSTHSCQTPYFSEIPEEFLRYLQNERHHSNDYPFLLELAHYEWVEMALSISKEHHTPLDKAFISDLQHHKITLSALAWPLVYQYPVQQISPAFLPEAVPEQPTYLVVYRNRDDEVHFIQLNAMTCRLLQIIQESEGLGSGACLQQLVTESRHPKPQTLLDGGMQILQDMAEKGIIIPYESGNPRGSLRQR